MKPRKRRLCLNSITFRILLQELVEGDRTYAELVAASGLGHEPVATIINELRAYKLVYVSDWSMGAAGRMDTQCFSLDTTYSCKDLPRPAPLTGAQRQAKCRARRIAARALGGHYFPVLPGVNDS